MRYKQDHHNFNFISFNYTDSLERCLSVFADGIIARRRINGSEYLNKIGTIVHIHGTKTNLPKQKERLEKRYNELYDIISDEEKKELISTLVKEIQIYPEGESEMLLKSMKFNFPVYKDGKEVREIFLYSDTNVETLVYLKRG